MKGAAVDPFEAWLALPPGDTRTIDEMVAGEPASYRPRDGFVTAFVVVPAPRWTAPEHCPTCGVGAQEVSSAADFLNARHVFAYAVCGHRFALNPEHPRELVPL